MPRDSAAKHIPQRRRKTPRPPITKQIWQPGTMLCPVPVVLVSSASAEGVPNVMTAAWAGTVCSEPPMLSVSLRKQRYTYDLVMASREFVVNVPSPRLIRATDYCGVVSGRDVNKFEKARLTPAPATVVKAPVVLECPINIECVVKQILDLGVHTMFVAEIVAVQVSSHLVTESGRLALEKEGLAAYSHGGYYALGKKLGYFGFSVKKSTGD